MVLSDPQERHNRASEPGMEARIERLARSIERANADAYVSGSLDPQTLSVHYEEIMGDPEGWAEVMPTLRASALGSGRVRSAWWARCGLSSA